MLNTATGATAADNALQAQYDKQANAQALKTASQMSADFGNACADYLKEGILLGGDLSAGGTLSILQNGFITDNSAATATVLATAVCNFLETNITPGLPQVGTSVVSVTIAASAKISIMAAAILGVVSSPPATTGWINFYNAIDPIVKTIECTIIELVQPGSVPTPFVRFIT